MRIGILLLAASVSVILGLTSAEAFSARNGLRAFGNAQEFEVFGSSAGSRLFCAAGEFARHHLGAKPNDNVVMTRGYGPSPNTPGQRSASFALVGPDGDTDWGGGVILRGNKGVGQNRTVAHATFLCDGERR